MPVDVLALLGQACILLSFIVNGRGLVIFSQKSYCVYTFLIGYGHVRKTRIHLLRDRQPADRGGLIIMYPSIPAEPFAHALLFRALAGGDLYLLCS